MDSHARNTTVFYHRYVFFDVVTLCVATAGERQSCSWGSATVVNHETVASKTPVIVSMVLEQPRL